MSSIAWIDFDEAESKRAQYIMALFQERESRDELGLGAIGDSIADHLFSDASIIPKCFVESFNRCIRDEPLDETPTAYAAHLIAIGRHAASLESSARRPVASNAPDNVTNPETLVAAGRKFRGMSQDHQND